MTSESAGGEERRWLLEPPSPGTFRFVFELGEGAELTPEVSEALEQLASALNEVDVQGYSLLCDTLWSPLCPSKTNACPSFNVCPCEVGGLNRIIR